MLVEVDQSPACVHLCNLGESSHLRALPLVPWLRDDHVCCLLWDDLIPVDCSMELLQDGAGVPLVSSRHDGTGRSDWIVWNGVGGVTARVPQSQIPRRERCIDYGVCLRAPHGGWNHRGRGVTCLGDHPCRSNKSPINSVWLNGLFTPPVVS